MREEMLRQGADLMVITAMDENAWLFNLRGGDVPHNPGENSINQSSKTIIEKSYSL